MQLAEPIDIRMFSMQEAFAAERGSASGVPAAVVSTVLKGVSSSCACNYDTTRRIYSLLEKLLPHLTFLFHEALVTQDR